jgi:two-component system, response regulator PdtaR
VRIVIVAFSDPGAAGKIKSLLAGRGLPVRGVCQTGSQVLQMAAECEGGGVIACPLAFSDMTAREVMSLLPDSFDMLVLITARQQGMIGGSGIFPMTLPADGAMIADGIRQLLETRQIRAALAGEASQPHRPDSLPSDRYKSAEADPGHERGTEERKIIEQAKYLLMNRKQISEAEAHRYLQKKSMASGVRMVDLARRIISPE